ncbi:unnamed protein product, partial [Polarella glacialis]
MAISEARLFSLDARLDALEHSIFQLLERPVFDPSVYQSRASIARARRNSMTKARRVSVDGSSPIEGSREPKDSEKSSRRVSAIRSVDDVLHEQQSAEAEPPGRGVDKRRPFKAKAEAPAPPELKVPVQLPVQPPVQLPMVSEMR